MVPTGDAGPARESGVKAGRPKKGQRRAAPVPGDHIQVTAIDESLALVVASDNPDERIGSQ